jgi:ATP-binding cassette, subfamily B, bacterial MsbA
MSSIVSVLGFTWNYVRRYWIRLALSFVFGIVFALSNGSFIWATKTLVGRFDVDAIAPGKPNKPSSFPASPRIKEFSERFKEFGRQIERAVDPWLPRKGQPIGWRQMVGGLFFLPLLVAVRAGSDYLNNYCIGWVSERVIRDVRLDLMTRLSALSLDFFSRFKTGDLLTRINMDTHNLLRSLRVGGADLIKESLTAVVVFGGLCFLDPLLTLCTLVLVPLLLFPLFVLGKKARRATKASLKANVRQSSQLVELLASIRVVKAFGLEGEQLARFRKTSGQIVHAGMKGVQAKELVNPLIEVVAVMGLGLLLLYVFQSGRSGAHLAAFLTGVLFLLQPVKKLAGLHILFEQAGVGTARLKELMSERPSVKEAVTPKPVAGFNHEIKFENVTFGFGDKVVLQDFSLTIPRGFRVGLAGESGCGKTTILNLLYRFYDPAQGTVRLDGIDLRDLSMDELRSQMALVSQEIVIFDQTIAENIACGKGGATRDEVELAARAAFAHDFILKLPQGYDTQVGERGANLSGGQRQRISIARAFVRNAPILVLDEATAALDSKAEAEVQADIDRLAENRTVICVAHRLSTLASMDRIVVLAEGRIIESGGFDELLRARGVFSGMAARQGIFLGRGQ